MDDSKVLEMRLEDEPFLNSKPNFGQNLIGLHNRGIYTLKDFINMDLKTIPNTETRNTFLVLIEILKYKYLGIDLVFDVLFDKVYPTTYEEYLMLKDEFHYPFATKETFMDSMLRVLKKDCGILGIPFRPLKFKRLLRNNFMHSDKKQTITMKEYMEDENIRDGNYRYLIDFYFEYIKTKENKKDENISSELESLKKQLISLTSQRDELDKQITELQNQIAVMSEGKNNGRN